MVRWGHGRTERWRCPPCGQKRRKKRHHTIEGKFGAPRQETPEPRVVIEDSDLTLYHGDCLDVLSALPDRSVHMAATSPPFYGLRDYGVDGQIGLEETPDEWVERLVEVFSEVRRVLRDDGTLWVEIGDSYAANRSYQVADSKHRDVGNDMPGRVPPGLKPKDMIGQPWLLAFALRADGWYLRSEIIWSKPNAMPESITDRPTKAHSTVFLLSKSPRYFYDQNAIRQAYSDNTHSKGMGIGVKMESEQEAGTMQAGRNNASFGRATQRSHVDAARLHPQAETLDGSEGEAPRSLNRGAGQGFRWNSPHYTEQEGPLDNTLGGLPPEAPRGPDGRRVTAVKGKENSHQHRDGERWPNPEGANARTVWTVATEPTPFAHFATWPTKLVARMIQAGTSEKGCCPECGAPWMRETTPSEGGKRSWHDHTADMTRGQTTGGGQKDFDTWSPPQTIGWSPTCDHGHDPVPATVLDCFAGSGTTLFVARALGRHSLGIELNEDYCKLAADRTQQLSLLT